MTEQRPVRPGRDPVSAKLLEMLYLSRKRKGWTVRDLARAADVSPSYISLIENGQRIPDADTMERIGRALDLEPGLLSAWVTVQSRGTDVASSIEAAHRLMTSLELSPEGDAHTVQEAGGAWPAGPVAAMRSMESPSDAVAALEMPQPARYVLGVVLAEEGYEPAEEEIRDADRRVWLDRRALPERGRLRGAFAWRVTWKGLTRVPGLYRAGDVVVIAPDVWSPDAIHPRQVFAIRQGSGVILSRIAWADGMLVLLAPPDQPGGTSVVPAPGERQLRERIAGRVIAAVQRFR